MITYSLNWMGPISMDWFRERGLTKKVTRVVEEDDFLVDVGAHRVGDVLEYDEIITYYSAGRIDIRDSNKEGYDGWNEYSLPAMHGEDWNKLSEWLYNFKTQRLYGYHELIDTFEEETGIKIRWADD